MIRGCFVAMLILSGLATVAPGLESTPAQRGEKALLGNAYIPPAWSAEAYLHAWRHWPEAPREAPPAYDEAFREHYGLHPAPYPNGRYPMGLREVSFLGRKGIANDCLLCHAASICGQSYVGLGNTSLDFQAFWEDLNAGDGREPKTPFVFSNVRGTSEAGSMSIFLLSYRDPDLKVRRPPHDLGLKEHLCEDVPAWWLLKKKKTMYHTGSTDARSVRALMQFMMSPINSPATIKSAEADFADIQAYILSLQAPRYPFPVDGELAHKGEGLFRENCARCHGTYESYGSHESHGTLESHWTYPNKIVPIDVIGTDRTRSEGFTEQGVRHYNKSWFAQEKPGWLADEYPGLMTAGYQAPPLDGIWATAPYFHNGSVPTLYNVLNSRSRPRIYTRSFRTGKEDYDPVKVGWKVRVLERGPDPDLPAIERRRVYDTTRPGQGKGGHTFGDDLTEEERSAVIEYLKTL